MVFAPLSVDSQGFFTRTTFEKITWNRVPVKATAVTDEKEGQMLKEMPFERVIAKPCFTNGMKMPET